jgi:hypothetical protein
MLARVDLELALGCGDAHKRAERIGALVWPPLWPRKETQTYLWD